MMQKNHLYVKIGMTINQEVVRTKCIIITGTSRGLGAAIAAKLLNPDNMLFCISRQENIRLINHARPENCPLEYLKVDLANLSNINALMGEIIQNRTGLNFTGYYLVNNAGMINPIKPIGKCTDEEIIANVTINSLAPLLLANSFIKHTNQFHGDKRIINISSGAGCNPHFGLGAYCSSKAALNMFTRCVGIEQKQQEYPVKIWALTPGIMDTDMQADIRGATRENFSESARFIELKNAGRLRTAEFVADKVIKLLFGEDLFVPGSLIDIRDL